MISLGNVEILAKGKQAFITKQQPQLDEVCVSYGRDSQGLCLKVFYGNPMTGEQGLKDALWGDNPSPTDVRKNNTVFEASQIQNILWKHGLAPRVYALFEAELGGDRIAVQLTDYVEGEPEDNIQRVYKMWENIEALGKIYGFTAPSHKMGFNDVINGQCVDPQLWAFEKKSYLETVKEIYFEKGRYGKIYYQNDEALELHGGPRHSEDRIKYMQLDKIDFANKVVWDVGCAGGFFLRYAEQKGAKRAIGMDLKEPIEAAFHVGNLLGLFNIDYLTLDLSKPIPADIVKPDIAFFLSMIYHIPVPERLFEATILIYEDNGKETRQLDKLTSPWTDHYPKIEFVGRGLDHGDKACYILEK